MNTFSKNTVGVIVIIHIFMNQSKFVAFLLLVTLCLGAVPQLTSEQFHSQLTSTKPFIIKFFSPNCGHCVVMAPEYQKLWEKSQKSDYEIFQVDCTTQDTLCQVNKIESYPTLKLFFNGISFDYNGQTAFEAMKTWISDTLSSDLIELTAEQIGKKRQTENFLLIGGLGELSRRAIAIAAKLSNHNSVNIFYFKQSYLIRLFKASSREYIDYQTDQNFPTSLIEWANINNRNNILSLDDKNLKYLKEQNSFSQFLGIVKEKQFTQIQGRVINQFCRANFKTILCFEIDKSSDIYENLEVTLKVTQGQNKIIIINKSFEKGYHYPHEAITLSKLTEFLKDASGNKLTLVIDAERDFKQGIQFINVVKLTKETYDKTIAQKQFVFIQFYSKTSGHCVEFAPKFEKVARHFKNNPNVVIAGVDVQEQNQLRIRQNIHGYPHFRLYIRENLVYYRYYKRMNDVDALIQFITEAITTKIQEISCKCAIRSPKPYIIISGIDKNSHLNMLPALFKKYPIYLLKDRSQFKIEIHRQNVKKYEGIQDIWEIADFLQIDTSPVLVKLGQSQPSRKLQKALSQRKSILAIINKHQKETVKHVLSLLQAYCQDIDKFVCGQLHKGDEDYDHLISQLGENNNEDNSLYWINLTDSNYWKFRGDLQNITIEELDHFVREMTEEPLNDGQNVEEQVQSSQQQL